MDIETALRYHLRAGGIMMIDPPERQPSMLSRLLGKATT